MRAANSIFSSSCDILKGQTQGPVAQLGARFHGMEEVVSSNLTRSTKSFQILSVSREPQNSPVESKITLMRAADCSEFALGISEYSKYSEFPGAASRARHGAGWLQVQGRQWKPDAEEDSGPAPGHDLTLRFWAVRLPSRALSA